MVLIFAESNEHSLTMFKIPTKLHFDHFEVSRNPLALQDFCSSRLQYRSNTVASKAYNVIVRGEKVTSPSNTILLGALCFSSRWTVHSRFHFDNFNKQPGPQGVSKEQEDFMPELKQGFTCTACLSVNELQAASLIVFTYD